MNQTNLRIGSRDSKLAVIQSEIVMEMIRKKHPEIKMELITMKTTGDIILDKTLDKIGGKGLFVKELDMALRENRIDLAVHSLKDVPMELPPDLPIVAFTKREDPSDALILPDGATGIVDGKPLGSSSLRRNLQLKKLYPEKVTESVRGNVQTRLAKLDKGEYGALILATAGLKRLNLEHRISRLFLPDEMIPAAGQGIMAVQGRIEDSYPMLDCVDDKDARDEALAERAFVRMLDGGCSSPVAAFAVVKENEITLKGLYYIEETAEYIIREVTGERQNGEAIGKQLALQLKAEGEKR